ncbi:MAG: hypothetical protein AAGF79_13800 [Pseudomonadota bacterium]
MSDNFEAFDQRLRRIDRTRRKLANGYEMHVQTDGLIVARPRRMRSIGISPRAFILFFAGLFLFKGLLIAHLGTVSYGERVLDLSQGSVIEQAGAWAMQIDPISQEVASVVAPYLN